MRAVALALFFLLVLPAAAALPLPGNCPLGTCAGEVRWGNCETDPSGSSYTEAQVVGTGAAGYRSCTPSSDFRSVTVYTLIASVAMYEFLYDGHSRRAVGFVVLGEGAEWAVTEDDGERTCDIHTRGYTMPAASAPCVAGEPPSGPDANWGWLLPQEIHAPYNVPVPTLP